MAILMMVSKARFEESPQTVEIVTNYYGHETNRVCHHYNCAHKNDQNFINVKGQDCDTHKCDFYGPLYLETSYVGAVISTHERNGYHDSDFYAIVWDSAEQKPKQIEYATTRGWCYPNQAVEDATPEVMSQYNAYCLEQRRLAAERLEKAKAKIPSHGKTVKVVAGRKLPIGTVADVFWIGVNKFKPQRYDKRNYEAILTHEAESFEIFADYFNVGLRLLDGTKVFVSAKNVEVING